jgi:hypothetical protein
MAELVNDTSAAPTLLAGMALALAAGPDPRGAVKRSQRFP